MCAAHSFLWTQPRVLSTMENPGVKGSFCGGYPARDQRFPSLLPIAEPRRGQGAATSPSPTSFSIPQTSRVSNAPVLRNIRRSSRRNHRLLGRETTLKGTLSSRKIKGGGEGGATQEADFWPHASGSDPSVGLRLGRLREQDLAPPAAERRAEGGRGGREGYLPGQRSGRFGASAPPGLLFPSSPPPPRIGSDGHIPSASDDTPRGRRGLPAGARAGAAAPRTPGPSDLTSRGPRRHRKRGCRGPRPTPAQPRGSSGVLGVPRGSRRPSARAHLRGRRGRAAPGRG